MRLPLILATLGALGVIRGDGSIAGPSTLAGGPADGPDTIVVGEGAARGAIVAHESAPRDPIAALRQRLESGELTLAYDSAHGYLPALLAALDVPVSSQALVFSRTSLQTDRIAPWAPRALYFNDDVYVGWVQESPIIEIASIDPQRGAVFYTLGQVDASEPQFSRETTTCLMCHESRSITGGVPGLIVRSVLADRLGYFITNVHEGVTTDRTPIEQRWGGWYVTGTLDGLRHAGNVRAPLLSHEVPVTSRYLAEVDLTAGSGTTELGDHFYTDAYLAPHSDVVALMVLTHQAQVHNLITLVQEEATAALRLHELRMRARGDSEGGADSIPAELVAGDGPVERLVRTLLFVREAPLAGPVRGTSTFVDDFAARGPHDALGRSLRDLDLQTRLFRYPLSFMIYSDAFDALPAVTRRIVGRRLSEILSGRDTDPDFAHLGPEERSAIKEILEETKPGLLAPTD